MHSKRQAQPAELNVTSLTMEGATTCGVDGVALWKDLRLTYEGSQVRFPVSPVNLFLTCHQTFPYMEIPCKQQLPSWIYKTCHQPSGDHMTCFA